MQPPVAAVTRLAWASRAPTSPAADACVRPHWRTMSRIGSVVAVGVLVIAIGQSPAERPPTTQFDLNVAANEELKAAEHQMQAALGRLRARVPAQSDARVLLDKAQEAWVVYRDAQLAAMWPSPNKQAEYGTVYPMCVSKIRT